MVKKFLKKIIAQNQEDLRVISALCSEARIKQSDIKFLKDNKIFLISLERENKEKNNSKEKILIFSSPFQSVCLPSPSFTISQLKTASSIRSRICSSNSG